MKINKKLIFLAIRYGHEETISRLDFLLTVILLLAYRAGYCYWGFGVAMGVFTVMQEVYSFTWGFKMRLLMKKLSGVVDEFEALEQDEDE